MKYINKKLNIKEYLIIPLRNNSIEKTDQLKEYIKNNNIEIYHQNETLCKQYI